MSGRVIGPLLPPYTITFTEDQHRLWWMAVEGGVQALWPDHPGVFFGMWGWRDLEGAIRNLDDRLLLYCPWLGETESDD